jgi:two-component system cell cycle sensor histidine kinase/response regulator CckA
MSPETLPVPELDRVQPPAGVPDEDPSPASKLSELVHHRDWVDAQTPLADVQKLFQDHPGDFRAIVDRGGVVGLCSRATVGFMLGSRYGFSLYGNSPVMTARAPRPLIYRRDASLPRVLDEALSRQGSEFFEDIVLVDEHERLVGLVPVPSLARLQLKLFGEQLARVTSQDGELREQNLALFQINNQLRQSQGRYKALFENNALGVALLDPDGVIVAHNRRFEQLLQLQERPQASFQLASWMTSSAQQSFRRLLAAHERAAPDTEPSVTEVVFELPRGARRFELHSSWVVETGQICVFFEDVTEQHLLKQRIARQEKQNMLDTLVAGVAHELNNKLTPVLGFADLLQLVAPEPMRAHTLCIRQSAAEAAQIIRQLLNLSRPAGGQANPVELGGLCREALQMLRFQLMETRCEQHLHLPAEPVWVRGDPVQLKQVLINLVLNAMHAMEGVPQPQITLTLQSDGASVVLGVRDVGSGISPENLSRIFDPFFTTKGPRGTGLGLSVSLGIVQQHGGEIIAESTPGEGSIFSIHLPVGQPPSALQTTAAEPAEPVAHPGPSRRRALVVDDEEFVRQYMQEALRVCFNCSVEGVPDGLDAVEKLRRGHYDLILSDIRMPRMDGFQLRAWLAENRPDLSGRLVFVTGHAGAVDLDQNLGGLPLPVIRKPFTLDTIAAICRPILESSSESFAPIA